MASFQQLAREMAGRTTEQSTPPPLLMHSNQKPMLGNLTPGCLGTSKLAVESGVQKSLC